MEPPPPLLMSPLPLHEVQNQQPLSSLAAGGGGKALAASAAPSPASAMMSPLQNIMQAVKKEANALEAVKAKIREMDGLRDRMNELKVRLQQSEEANLDLKRTLSISENLSLELRGDMQRLNDIYNSEHAQYIDVQQSNLRLDQELKQVKHEAAFFQKEATKIPDLRKKNNGLMEQMSKASAKHEEDRAAMLKQQQMLQAQLDEASKARVEATSHTYFLTEEIKALKREVEMNDDAKAAAALAIKASQSKASVAQDRAAMLAEDFSGSIARTREDRQKANAEVAALKAEADSLRTFLNSKDDAHIAISAKLKSIVDARQAEKQEVKGKIAGLTETISALKAKNHELEREVSESNHRLGMMGGDVGRYTMELEHMQAEVTRAEQSKLELSRELKAVQLSRDDALEKLKVATTQFEAMQNQSRDAQSRYWEELQRVKEAEAQLTEEADHLSRELEEKTTRLIAMETERAKMDEYMRGEVTGASQMTAALRGELERRLEELAATRKERDSLHEENAALNSSVAELKSIMSRNEAQMKKTLEADRTKLQSEMKGKLQRLRTLEGEKAELLKETNELMQNIQETQREVSKARSDLEQAHRTAADLTTQVEDLRGQNHDMAKEVKISAQKEKELREHSTRVEAQFKEDCQRLDSLVKESRKAAAAQVLEITSRVKDAQEEIELLKAQKNECVMAEKKALADADKARAELEMQTVTLQEMQQRMAADMTTLRRELQDSRNKSKIMAESRTKMEMETMNARVEATKSEAEAQKMAEWVKDVEGKLQAAGEQYKKLDTEHREVLKEQKRLKLKSVDLEESVAKKTAAIEKLTKDVAKSEREGQVEARRLRVQLANAEQEIAELKPTLQLLEKELAEGRSSFSKLQGSTNSTVNGLLEELRATEDALSAERKKGQTELELARLKISELQSNLEKAREHIEENVTRTKADRSDKEMRMLQLENEMDRIKVMVAEKEKRMGELEKQHQEDRKRIHELKEGLDRSERALVDGKTNLELEQAQRRRLEARLRQAQTTGSGGGGGGGGHRGGGDSHTASDSLTLPSPGTSAARAQMLYGDDHTDDGSLAYDVSVYAVGRDDDPELLGRYEEYNASPGAKFPYKAGATGAGGGGGSGAGAAGKAAQRASSLPQPDDDILYQAATHTSPIAVSSAHSSSSGNGSGNGSGHLGGGLCDGGSMGHSPAVDRVAAALAARAAAESTKAQMKQAQALKREQGAPPAAGSVHSEADLRQFTVLPRKNSKGKVTEVRELVGQASSVMADDGYAEDSGGGAPAGSSAAEDSIARTQMFLRQRLAKATTGGAGADAARQTAESAAATAAHVAQQALERQQQAGAVYLYEQETDGGVSLSAPSLTPAGPPQNGSGVYYTHSEGTSLRHSGIAGLSADSGAAPVSLPKIKGK